MNVFAVISEYSLLHYLDYAACRWSKISITLADRTLLLLMESATNNLDISRESCLSIDLRAGKEETSTSKLHPSKNDSSTKPDLSLPSKMSSLLPSPISDMPARRRPYNLSLEIPSTGKILLPLPVRTARTNKCSFACYCEHQRNSAG